MTTKLYEFDAELIKDVDGDTIWVRVDLGFRFWHDVNLRIEGINAPEMKTAEGKVAKAAAIDWLDKHKSLRIRTEKDPGSYNRYTANVWDTATGDDFAKFMLDSHNAVPYVYKWS